MKLESRILKQKVKMFVPLVVVILLVMPVLANADLIPCTNDCDFEDLLELANNIINWVIMIAIPVSAIVFAWAGILYMTTAVAGKKDKAKDMLWKVFWGLVMILAAWLIVTTITNTLLSPDFQKVVPLGN